MVGTLRDGGHARIHRKSEAAYPPDAVSLSISAQRKVYDQMTEMFRRPRPASIAVEGGGCSGFQYEIDLDEPGDSDLVLEGAGEKVVIDDVSLPFLADAVIDFTEELIGARFVIDNPNATSSCGCGTSFSM